MAGIASAAAQNGPQLTGNSEAKAGFYTLHWQSDGTPAAGFELQQAPSDDFNEASTIYTGADTAYAMSGQPNGAYHYRVRAVAHGGPAGPWSEVFTVSVRHHTLVRAFTFFTIGLVVFLATLALVVHGAWFHRRESTAYA